MLSSCIIKASSSELMTWTLEDLDEDLELTLLVLDGLLGGARLLESFDLIPTSVDGDLDGDDDFSILVEICDMLDLKIEHMIIEHTYDTYQVSLILNHSIKTIVFRWMSLFDCSLTPQKQQTTVSNGDCCLCCERACQGGGPAELDNLPT